LLQKLKNKTKLCKILIISCEITRESTYKDIFFKLHKTSKEENRKLRKMAKLGQNVLMCSVR